VYFSLAPSFLLDIVFILLILITLYLLARVSYPDIRGDFMPSLSRPSTAPQVAFQTPATWVDALALVATTARPYTVPLDASGKPAALLRLSGALETEGATSNLFYNCYGTAAIPAADILNGTASIQAVPPLYLLPVPQGVTQISFIASAAAVLIIEAWSR
jgi:hypothetical protein